MQKSKLFNYVKNQVLLGNFNAEELTILVGRNIITSEERDELLLF